MAPPEVICTTPLRAYEVPGTPHPLAGTVYTAPPLPTTCNACSRRGDAMSAVTRGAVECSHLACPNRKHITAQPSAQGVRFDE